MTARRKKPGLFLVPREAQFKLDFGRSEEEARKELGEILGLDLTNPPVSDHYRPAFEQMIAKLLRHRERKLKSKAS